MAQEQTEYHAKREHAKEKVLNNELLRATAAIVDLLDPANAIKGDMSQVSYLRKATLLLAEEYKYRKGEELELNLPAEVDPTALEV